MEKNTLPEKQYFIKYYKISKIDINKIIKFKVDAKLEIMKEIYKECNKIKIKPYTKTY